MPIIKEWTCKACGNEFERIHPLCPRCESDNVGRAFRTPPGINGGVHKPYSAKLTDRIIEGQFAKLGISNFHTMEFGRANKVEWSPKHFRTGYEGSTNHGVEQAPLMAGFGINNLIQSGFNPAGLKKEGAAYEIPPDAHGAYIPPGTPIGGPPEALYKRTSIVGGVDVVGNQVVRVK